MKRRLRYALYTDSDINGAELTPGCRINCMDGQAGFSCEKQRGITRRRKISKPNFAIRRRELILATQKRHKRSSKLSFVVVWSLGNMVFSQA